ncbi:hypothetical protein K443DRAFT_117939 [Laccaria amethystina LaAM-08-1]|uniref:Uncharacterized protein n=1 Tax=Laccaria amethystina LaAM-08-1 TaxID=1095629 RepID=A0A0C9WKJ1_9AGAR|nr:hypothetical protein K443DRAFT_117939 [Laccaria amethystina LaAM-08-1]
MAQTPSDPLKIVKNGTLWYHKNRDARFPYLYKVETHPLVHNTDVIKHIYVYVEDTRSSAMRVKRLFEKDLKVPLGPDKTMAGHGLFELEEGSVIYVRKRRDDNLQDPKTDVVVAWVVGGCVK